jgi:hypothetical protein
MAMSGLSIFTTIHTLLSIIALVAGIPVLRGLIGAPVAKSWTSTFLVTAIATSITGFFFPFHGMTPAIGVGIVATIVLAFVLLARYSFKLAGAWRWIYAIGVVLSEYFLAFVAVAQAFAKVPALHALAPTQAEPPFGIAQGIVLVIFIVLAVLAVKKFRPGIVPRLA